MVAGTSRPALASTHSPNIPLTTGPTCTTAADSDSPAGKYPIVCTGAVLSGYTFSYVAGTMTVTAGAEIVRISAKKQHMKPGASLPVLTYEIRPTSATLTTNPTCTTTATSSSPLGDYSINCFGAAFRRQDLVDIAGSQPIALQSNN